MRVVERVGSAAAVVAVGALALISTGLSDAAAGPPGSPDLVSVAGHDVNFFEASPNGSVIQYVRGGVTEVVPTSGGASLATINNGSFKTFSADSQLLVYTADLNTPGRFELFATTIATGVATPLSQAMTHADGDVASWAVSADSQTVVYTADPTVEDDFNLYAVAVTGGSVTTLSTLAVSPLTLGDDVNISPDSATVVFAVRSGPAADQGLYVVPIDGSAGATRISDQAQHGEIADWKISADGQWVVYQASRSGSTRPNDTYAVPIAGGTPVRLHPGAPAGSTGGPAAFEITPDSARVILRVSTSLDNQLELFSIPIAGGTVTKLNHDLGGGDVASFSLTADSATVLYQAGGIYRVPVGGGTPVDITAATPALDHVMDWVLAADGEHVVYRIFETFTEAIRLYAVPVEGGTPLLASTALGDPDEPGQVEPDYLVSPDGRVVVFESDNLVTGTTHLYATALGGGSPIQLNDADTADRIFAIGFAGSNTVLYSSDGANEFDEEQVFSVDISTVQPPAPTPTPTATATPTTAPMPTPTPTVVPAPTPTPRPDGCTIVGTEGDDVLVGTSGPDVICGFGGDDVLRGRGGADVLKGGPGNDELRGGSGADRLFGGPGDDELRGQKGPDELRGGKGADNLLGGSGRDNLLGQSGPDVLSGGSAPDRLRGGTGRDILDGGTGRDDIKGGPGVDRVVG